MLPLTVPEVRRLLLAQTGPPERCAYHWAWSIFRRRHQASARHAHIRRRLHAIPVALAAPPIQTLPAGPPELTDEQWGRAAALVSSAAGAKGRPPLDHRRMLAGMLWVVRTGCAWHHLPEAAGPWRSVRNRYQRWLRDGTWQRIVEALLLPTP